MHLVQEEFYADDDDGHFPGGQHDHVKLTIRKLNHVKTRRWTYIMVVALRARYVAPTKKQGAHLDSRLTDAEYRVLTTLVHYASPDLQSSFPGLPKLAEDYGWSLKVLRRLVQSLTKKGWLRRQERSSLGTAINRFCVPPGVLAPWDTDGWICPKDPPP